MNRFGVRILVGIAGVGRSASIAQPGQEVWPAAPAALAVWGIALVGGGAGGSLPVRSLVVALWSGRDQGQAGPGRAPGRR